MNQTTYKPILEKKRLSRWGLFKTRPLLEPATAFVFLAEGKPLRIIKYGERGLTRGEMIWGGYNLLYKVDLQEKFLIFKFDLPCKSNDISDAFSFKAEVSFRCSVAKPDMIVERQVEEVSQYLAPLMEEGLREISRNYETTDVSSAEDKMKSKLKEIINEEGFEIKKLFIKLSFDEDVKEILREQQKLQLRKRDMDITNKRKLLEDYLAQNPNSDAILSVLNYLNQQEQSRIENLFRAIDFALEKDIIDAEEVRQPIIELRNYLTEVFKQSLPILNSGSQVREISQPEVQGENDPNKSSESKRDKFDWDKDG